MRTDSDLSAELGAKPSGNVLTFLSDVAPPKILLDQEHTGNRQTLRRAVSTISVKGSSAALRGVALRSGERRSAEVPKRSADRRDRGP
jgi:hypothetical protein